MCDTTACFIYSLIAASVLDLSFLVRSVSAPRSGTMSQFSSVSIVPVQGQELEAHRIL